MKQFVCMTLTVSALIMANATQAASSADERFLAARDAARAGDSVKLARLSADNDGSPLDAYLDYWALSIRLARKENADADLSAFTQREEGTLIAERARGEWIRAAARDERWSVVLDQAPRLRSPDQEMKCWLWQARLQRGETEALNEAESLWGSTSDPGEACTPVIAALSPRKTVAEHWQRARRLAEVRRYGAARATLMNLPVAEMPNPQQLSEVLDKPIRYLTRNPSPVGRRNQELTVLALLRLAQNDYRYAVTRIEALGNALSAEDRAYLSGILGWQAARGNQSDALAWYRAAGSAPLSEEQRAWHVRTALRAQDWGEVRRAIETMNTSQRAQPEWVYWYGRALIASGKTTEGRALLEPLAGQAHFYGMLAGEELGRGFVVPPGAQPATREEIARVSNDLSVRRALALFRLDSRIDGVREWNWAMRGADDRTLLAAAEIARREQVYDRAIYSAERTQTQHDYTLRYLTPYYDKIEPATRRWGLDLYWVYGLMRQESRFVVIARSSAGAQGLMQVMPGTAKYIAKRIGMPYSAHQATDMDTNLQLGTAYLRMMLDRLDNQPALASAAYNAGPGRIPRWKGAVPMEGAIFAETIPLNETRDYVKKVLANSVAYAALLSGKPQSLKNRLGTIMPDGLTASAEAALSAMPSGDGGE
ncbi:MAG: lytic transglycosylase domain-containing protein [Betaproteobacteria bacterium]|nr:lytic transglycosylase domain-containing protein [Betaproteobacteria bacterium]